MPVIVLSTIDVLFWSTSKVCVNAQFCKRLSRAGGPGRKRLEGWWPALDVKWQQLRQAGTLQAASACASVLSLSVLCAGVLPLDDDCCCRACGNYSMPFPRLLLRHHRASVPPTAPPHPTPGPHHYITIGQTASSPPCLPQTITSFSYHPNPQSRDRTHL